MARWLVYRTSSEVFRLLYVNDVTGAHEKLGDMRRDTPFEMVVDWVVMKGEPAPGDWLVFPDRVRLVARAQGEA